MTIRKNLLFSVVVGLGFFPLLTITEPAEAHEYCDKQELLMVTDKFETQATIPSTWLKFIFTTPSTPETNVKNCYYEISDITTASIRISLEEGYDFTMLKAFQIASLSILAGPSRNRVDSYRFQNDTDALVIYFLPGHQGTDPPNYLPFEFVNPSIGGVQVILGLKSGEYPSQSVKSVSAVASGKHYYKTPEPLTILGTGVVLGAIPVLKKEYAKRKKKKDEEV